jgi:Htaa
MNEVTHAVRGRGTVASAVAMVAALTAFLVFAPLASAASDPLASGTTYINLNKGFFKKLKKSDVKVLKVKPGKVKNHRKVTLPVSGGSLDPTSGQGTVNNSGGIKFKHGKRTAVLKNFVLDTAKRSLTAKLGKRNLKIASVAQISFTREGFGTNVKIGKLKLTGKAAKELNKKLGFGNKSGKKHKRASASSKDNSSKKGPFKGNQVMGGSTSATQPAEVFVVASGNAKLALSASALEKLALVGSPPFPPGESPVAVSLAPVPPTSIANLGPPPTVAFPIAGGNIAPDASAGTVQTSGGLKLVQNLEAVTLEPGNVTTLTMGNIFVDMSSKQATVEVTIENPVTEKANLGNLGRVSIADISLAGATISSDPTNHTVTVLNAAATLQAVTAETLNAVFIEGLEEALGPQGKFASGDPLGTISFTALTQ